MLRFSFVTGTEPGKWMRRYAALAPGGLAGVGSDDPLADLAAGACDLALVRLADARVSDAHHVVTLYEEAPGVAVPKDSVFAEVGEAVDAHDLADEIVNLTFDTSTTIDEVRAALQVVAANVGVVYAPKPLLKVLSKKQVVPLDLRGAAAESATSTSIALVWNKEDDCDAIQDFVGVAKGRTANSSRSAARKKTVRKKPPRSSRKTAQSTRRRRR